VTHIVPSRVVQFIDAAFAWSKDRAGQRLTQDHALEVAAIVDLVDAMPEAHLATLEVDEHVRLLGAIAGMRAAVAGWRSGGHPGHATPLSVMQGLRGWHPISTVRALLEKCPDDIPTLAAHELGFLGDAELQYALRMDISNAHHAHARRDFKSATVLGGSVVEALLCWALRRVDVETLKGAIASSDHKKLNPSMTGWSLGNLLTVGKALAVLKPETHDVADTVRDYRNLIHPERAARLGMACDEGTSHVALGCLLHVIRDVDAWAVRQGTGGT
jgi:hypothetical protein